MKHFQHLKSLSDSDLLLEIQRLSATERKTYALVIETLEKIERRKLYLARGYSSLFHFCTEHLKYSAAAAQRRIESMRLLKNFPAQEKQEVKDKIVLGALTLTHLSQVAKAVRNAPEPLSCHEKLSLLRKIEDTSSQESEHRLASTGLSPFPNREWSRPVPQVTEHAQTAETGLRLAITLSPETVKALEQFMALTAHQNPRGSRERAIELALEVALHAAVKELTKTKPKAKPTASSAKPTSDAEVKSELPRQASRSIPSALKREVWKRDEGICTYQDPATGRRCGTKFGLQIDHIREFSRGGRHEIGNLRLLCRNHNRHREIYEKGKPVDPLA